MWTYRASCQRVIDADTLVLNIDLGFFATISITARLAGIDAPELDTPAGKTAKQFVGDWIHADPGEWPLTVTTRKVGPRDRYGRWIATINRGDDNLNQRLIAAGHATTWPPTKP